VSGTIKRREFITLLGGASMAWPLVARAQGERVRRVGALLLRSADDPLEQARMAAFSEALQKLAWIDGRNVRFDIRWTGGNADNIRHHAAELAALAPDVIFVSGQISMASMLQATRVVPIVFAAVADPVASGFVDSLAHPGGNATGFMQFEYSLSGKWPELLKEIAPGVTRAAVLWDPTVPQGIGQFAVIQSVTPSLGLEVSPIRDRGEIERAFEAFARRANGNGGLIVTAAGGAVAHQNLIIGLAARHKLPAVYFQRYFVAGGGLMSYGSDLFDQYRGAAGYVDRILRGQKPADLPVQAPAKYELVINLRTAKALGLPVPSTLLARADEVVE
jgi:putative ABC transport system substrate-binding protein